MFGGGGAAEKALIFAAAFDHLQRAAFDHLNVVLHVGTASGFDVTVFHKPVPGIFECSMDVANSVAEIAFGFFAGIPME
jgi:hypothetical protein